MTRLDTVKMLIEQWKNNTIPFAAIEQWCSISNCEIVLGRERGKLTLTFRDNN